MEAATEKLHLWISDYVEIRLEALGGDSLEIYIRRSDFESVAYPDRKEFVSSVAKAWCERVKQDFLP